MTNTQIVTETYRAGYDAGMKGNGHPDPRTVTRQWMAGWHAGSRDSLRQFNR
jgi:hypothetical protein